MRIELEGNPDYGRATVALEPDERVLTESGAMAWMDPGLDLRARMLGGVGRALVRKAVGRESFFLGEYSGPRGGRLGLSPTVPGTVVHERLQGNGLWLTAGSFLAAGADLEIRTRFGGLKSLLSGEGAFLLHLAGHGDLLFNGYGALLERHVDGELVVDSGHLAAFEEGLDYSIETVGGVKQTLFSGEGLVLRFRGQGRIWLQTRTLRETAGWITPFLRG